MMDTDDEVRDRATFYYHVLKKEDKQLSSSYILNSKSIHSIHYVLMMFPKKINYKLTERVWLYPVVMLYYYYFDPN